MTEGLALAAGLLLLLAGVFFVALRQAKRESRSATERDQSLKALERQDQAVQKQHEEQRRNEQDFL